MLRFPLKHIQRFSKTRRSYSVIDGKDEKGGQMSVPNQADVVIIGELRL